MGGSGRRRRVGPTDEWEQIELLCGWPEQRHYEPIRPLVLFSASADGRSRDTGAASGRTLQRRRIAAKICAYTYGFHVNRLLDRPQGRIKELWA